MIQIQRFTGARPGENCIMKPVDIDRSGEIWLYVPERHKTSHHGKQRAIVIDPQAQEILKSYLDREPDEYCFNPTEVVDAYLAEKHAKRVTPLSCGTVPGEPSFSEATPDDGPSPSGSLLLVKTLVMFNVPA